jgi:hypothetical protein
MSEYGIVWKAIGRGFSHVLLGYMRVSAEALHVLDALHPCWASRSRRAFLT